LIEHSERLRSSPPTGPILAMILESGVSHTPKTVGLKWQRNRLPDCDLEKHGLRTRCLTLPRSFLLPAFAAISLTALANRASRMMVFPDTPITGSPRPPSAVTPDSPQRWRSSDTVAPPEKAPRNAARGAGEPAPAGTRLGEKTWGLFDGGIVPFGRERTLLTATVGSRVPRARCGLRTLRERVEQVTGEQWSDGMW